ncbi:MAG: ATP:cob(I)alamin adenosyltransferase [Elusimicrobiales bacterium]|nr:ATP:cob(I)alamin adenosyltransferase [Elusimicrobiales bacterium]
MKHRGDRGVTGLPGGKRVKKSSARIRALAALDELNCQLGAARAVYPRGAKEILAAQRALIALCGQVAGAPADETLERAAAALDREIARLSALAPLPKAFIIPGESLPEAAVQLARAKCRTAETLVCALPGQPAAVKYLNRLSGYLFSLAVFARR